MAKLIKLIGVNFLVTIVLLILFDAGAYWFLPRTLTVSLANYRQAPSPDIGRQGGYSNGYFKRHPQRGFDIAENQTGRHRITELVYPIWSNSYGCFDREHDLSAGYIYLAGDSFTWGYSPYADKFGTLLEKQTDLPVLKCGVGHTGQQHQFSKMREIASTIGKPPETIFVFYFSNDIANDYAYPHTTEIRGWLVETTHLAKDYQLIRTPREELEEQLEEVIRTTREKFENVDAITRFKRRIKRFSLSINLLIHTTNKIGDAIRHARSKGKNDQNSPPAKNETRPARMGLYSLPDHRNEKFNFHGNDFAENNKDALLKFDRFSDSNGVTLVVVLIPPRERHDDTTWYAELRHFLELHEIRHLDLSEVFERKEFQRNDIYWRHDSHFNVLGNKVVAETLVEHFPDIFTAQQPVKP